MRAQTSPPFARRHLGRLLREFRARARVPADEACRRLEVSSSRLSRIETGQVSPDIHVVRSMLDLYGIPGDEWGPILDQVREAKKKGWWHAEGGRGRPVALRARATALAGLGYVALEAAACAKRDFSLAFVPGLLQTEDYMRAVFATVLLSRTVEHIDKEVAVRLRRSTRLTTGDAPLELVAVIDEGALRRPVGGVELMRAQLHHIVEMATLPNVTVQVVPTSVGAYHGMSGNVTLLKFHDPDEPDIAYLEHVLGALRLEKEEDVHRAAMIFDGFREAALEPGESVRTIRRVAAEL